MKQNWTVALALVCAVLIIFLIVMKRGDTAQHESDAGAIASFSNQLWSAQTDVAIGKGAVINLSNSLAECQSASLTFLNHLADAESTLVLDTEQITNLNRQIAELKSENQTLGQRVVDLTSQTSQMTNQVAGLTKQIAITQASLDRANADYALLENRLRRDVAERVVAERKFNNLAELQAQMQKLREHPAGEISAGSIYAGLDVEVKSNAFHVVSPNSGN